MRLLSMDVCSTPAGFQQAFRVDICRKQVWVGGKSLKHPQKSPIYPQQSPIYLHKSPIYCIKGAYNVESALEKLRSKQEINAICPCKKGNEGEEKVSSREFVIKRL